MTDSTRLKIAGTWDEIKGRAKAAWGELTHDDLDVAEGKLEELTGRIKRRTGATIEEIEKRLKG